MCNCHSEALWEFSVDRYVSWKYSQAWIRWGLPFLCCTPEKLPHPQGIPHSWEICSNIKTAGNYLFPLALISVIQITFLILVLCKVLKLVRMIVWRVKWACSSARLSGFFHAHPLSAVLCFVSLFIETHAHETSTTKNIYILKHYMSKDIIMLVDYWLGCIPQQRGS